VDKIKIIGLELKLTQLVNIY